MNFSIYNELQAYKMTDQELQKEKKEQDLVMAIITTIGKTHNGPGKYHSFMVQKH